MDRLTKIVDYLYLGSYNDIIKDYFRDVNTDVIINVAEECKNMLTHNDTIEYYHYLYNDRPGDKIHLVFDEIADLMNGYICDKKTVFIHCYAGRSRSAAFVLVYLMKYKGYELNAAYNYVDKLRGIYPNLGFINQLMDYEMKLTNKSTLDYDALCIDYIHSTIGSSVTIKEVKTAYYDCNKDVDLTMDKLFDR